MPAHELVEMRGNLLNQNQRTLTGDYLVDCLVDLKGLGTEGAQGTDSWHRELTVGTIMIYMYISNDIP